LSLNIRFFLLPILITASAYFAAGMLGQLLAIPPGFATIIWPASGLALGATLFWGWRALPGVILGSFGVNTYIALYLSSAPYNFTLPLLIGAGAALQAHLSAHLVKKSNNFPFSFHQTGKVVRFAILAGPVGCLTNATLSTAALHTTGTIGGDDILETWLSWWTGDMIGVVFVLPWLLTLFPKLSNQQVPHRQSLLISLILIASVSSLLAIATANVEQKKQQQEFVHQARTLAKTIQTELQTALDLLYGVSGFVKSHSDITPAAFKTYTEALLNNNSHVQGVSWNPVISGEQLDSFNQQLQRHHQNPNIRVITKNMDGEIEPVKPARQHVVVAYIEPINRNRPALGFDVYSNESRRIALDKAAVTGKPTPTEPIRLIQDRKSTTGVLIFLPIFTGETLEGYATVVLRAGSMVAGVLDGRLLENTGVRLSSVDSTGLHSTIYQTGLDATTQSSAVAHSRPLAMEHSETIHIGDHIWLLNQVSNSPYIYQPWGVQVLLAAGLLVAGLLNWILLIVTGHTASVETEVELRTRALKDSHQLLKRSELIAHTGSWQWDPVKGQNHWSDELYRLLGYSGEQTASVDAFLAMVHAEDRQITRISLQQWQHNRGETGILQCRMHAHNQSTQMLELHCKPQGQSGSMSIVVRDITELHHQQEQLKLAAATFQTQDAILITDASYRIQRVNHAFTSLTGHSSHQLIGQLFDKLQPEDRHESYYQVLLRSPSARSDRATEAWVSRAHKPSFLARISRSVVGNSRGHIEHYVFCIQDITAEKEAAQRIHNLAFFDPLTQLPNRAHLMQQLDQRLHSAKRYKERFAVMFLDLDGFKDVNDSMGHDTGDQLLCTISERITNAIRHTDFAARLGGDEFCVITNALPMTEDAAHVANKLLEHINLPFDLNGHDYQPRSSIGIAIYPDDGQDPNNLIKAADTAMYLAKNQGKNQFSFYHEQLTEQAVAQFRFETELRTAVYNAGLELYFQPQYSLNSGLVTGAEALLRWQHPTQGLLYPDQFLPTAERLKLCTEIDHWVLDAALSQLSQWRSGQQQSMRISVNIASTTFISDNFADTVEQVLLRYQIPATALELEFSSAAAVRSDKGRRTVESLRQLGVSLAIDNFGSTGSSLTDLTEIGFDTIKIDRSFIAAMIDQPSQTLLLGSMIGSAQGLQADIVALGVETLDQVRILHGLNCDTAQGFYFSHPVSADKMKLSAPPPAIKHQPEVTI